jgi:hypothetical protein
VHAHVVWAIEPKELEGKFIYAEPKPAQGIPDGWVIEESKKDYDIGQDVLIVSKDGVG